MAREREAVGCGFDFAPAERSRDRDRAPPERSRGRNVRAWATRSRLSSSNTISSAVRRLGDDEIAIQVLNRDLVVRVWWSGLGDRSWWLVDGGWWPRGEARPRHPEATYPDERTLYDGPTAPRATCLVVPAVVIVVVIVVVVVPIVVVIIAVVIPIVVVIVVSVVVPIVVVPVIPVVVDGDDGGRGRGRGVGGRGLIGRRTSEEGGDGGDDAGEESRDVYGSAP